MAPGGAGVVVERDLVPAGWARGQRPEPLTPTPPGAQVTRVRHCGDSYFVTTVDERPETLVTHRTGHMGNTSRQRSEEHTSELQSLMRTSYAVLCFENKKKR